jgi:hypothetical protein
MSSRLWAQILCELEHKFKQNVRFFVKICTYELGQNLNRLFLLANHQRQPLAFLFISLNNKYLSKVFSKEYVKIKKNTMAGLPKKSLSSHKTLGRMWIFINVYRLSALCVYISKSATFKMRRPSCFSFWHSFEFFIPFPHLPGLLLLKPCPLFLCCRLFPNLPYLNASIWNKGEYEPLLPDPGLETPQEEETEISF